MFFVREEEPIRLNEINNLVWYGKKRDRKRVVTQWADREFYGVWEAAMQEAFDLLGMMDRFSTMTSDEAGIEKAKPSGAEELIPVPGDQNRRLLRKATLNIAEPTSRFDQVLLENGTAIRYTGDKETALKQWGALTELLAQTTMMAIVTPGLQYYVQGTQVGYTPATRNLFRRSNTLERIGLPSKPHWRANVSGYVIDIHGDWDEIRKTRKSTGYNMFQMLQVRINEELEKALRKER
ncbi:hypothetical protein [Alicyclobacillus sp. SO9]|uniref:hypothetical protein n=1 Tax=Alicyclobacillus sp. SO9 TaxID=2665646 RepID=UPI0018E85EC0|nr:hypothetical protein [Alicyclobacillus sp. SO9]QQE80441.1 hypothetical protein GI364_08510 [Alicyclobacillus sp. SO9]